MSVVIHRSTEQIETKKKHRMADIAGKISHVINELAEVTPITPSTLLQHLNQLKALFDIESERHFSIHIDKQDDEEKNIAADALLHASKAYQRLEHWRSELPPAVYQAIEAVVYDATRFLKNRKQYRDCQQWLLDRNITGLLEHMDQTLRALDTTSTPPAQKQHSRQATAPTESKLAAKPSTTRSTHRRRQKKANKKTSVRSKRPTRFKHLMAQLHRFRRWVASTATRFMQRFFKTANPEKTAPVAAVVTAISSPIPVATLVVSPETTSIAVQTRSSQNGKIAAQPGDRTLTPRLYKPCKLVGQPQPSAPPASPKPSAPPASLKSR